ncbi:hypothetical protein E2F47_01780 [Mycobacterium eburneum]|nr:hypothetical protein [Mycobacterium eburneum]TDH57585.1 hypothetical protein E2F47_01780 [Mycobacterium eburneum]
MKPDADLDRVAEIAYGITEKLRDEPTRLYGELVGLWQQHPAKAAQLTMTLAAWFDPDTPMSVLGDRVESISRERAA